MCNPAAEGVQVSSSSTVTLKAAPEEQGNHHFIRGDRQAPALEKLLCCQTHASCIGFTTVNTALAMDESLVMERSVEGDSMAER